MSSSNPRYFAGIDIGGTKCAVLLAKISGADVNSKSVIPELFGRVEIKTLTGKQAARCLDLVLDALEKTLLENALSPSDLCAVGISCGSPLDSKKGIILSPPNLYGWDSVPICAIVSKRFGVPSFLQNDANACALAEWRFGAGKGCKNIVFLTMGTGMGAGLILNGALYCGASDMAGEIGHVRLSRNGPVGYGKSGSFEGFCSGGGIAQSARDAAFERLQCGEKTSYCASVAELSTISAKKTALAGDDGDKTALAVWKKTGCYLGAGISILIDLLNPELVIIGSIFTRSKHLLENDMMNVLENECLEASRRVCRIVPAALGECIGDYGAISAALYGLESNDKQHEGYVYE